MGKKSSNLFDEVITNAKNFVEKQKGKWDHSLWENFLKDIQKKGVSLTEETSGLIGSVLESLKKIYNFSPKTQEEQEKGVSVEQPSGEVDEKAVVPKQETPVVTKTETPLAAKQEMPVVEVPQRPRREPKKRGPGRKHLNNPPIHINKHPRLLRKKHKTVQMKKRRLG